MIEQLMNFPDNVLAFVCKGRVNEKEIMMRFWFRPL